MLFDAMRRKTVRPTYAMQADVRQIRKDIREMYAAFADEMDGLKDQICKQQMQINELRRLVDELRVR